MKLRLRARSALFIAAGLAITAIEVWGSVEYLIEQQGRLSYIVVLGAAVTAGAALIPLAMEMCWRDGNRLLALVVGLAFVPASLTIFLAAVERTGSARDVLVSSQRAAVVKIAAADRAEKDARADATVAETAAAAECAAGRGPICKGLEDRASAARTRLEQARQKRVEAGDLPPDPQARRISALSGFRLSETDVQLYAPLVLPITGSILGVLFLAVGGRMEHAPEPEGKPAGADIGKPIAEEPLPRQRGNVARYMATCLPVSIGKRVEIAEAYAAYLTWCRDENVAAHPPVDFRSQYLEVCTLAKIKLQRERGKVYCVDRMLCA